MDEMECGGRRQGIYFNFQSLRRKTSSEKKESLQCALLNFRKKTTYTKVAKKLSSRPFFPLLKNTNLNGCKLGTNFFVGLRDVLCVCAFCTSSVLGRVVDRKLAEKKCDCVKYCFTFFPLSLPQ